jgi:hypothetical protein
VSNSGTNDVLTFTAPGDDWNSGTAAKYEVRRSSRPITQDNFAAAASVNPGQQPKAAGSHETLTIPHLAGMDFYALRAIDAAGNIGPLQVLSGAAGLNPAGGVRRAMTSTLPNTTAHGRGGAPLTLLVTLLAMLAMIWAARRLTRTGGVAPA